ncbi:uncharacterized protein PFL1_02051 [Pseudozyma flocculosa PF-1]|nr:uncharacterized protein PFL1_02051 [Pseudozyma flocculosa PF-1]EPQ30525.1 hypothetical protein PFL1_02051 [Pseudozyma flocculosa PF-1]
MLDGSKTPSACMQSGDGGRGGNAASEDCLYITLYRPSSARSGSNLPVLVWIHGGSFTSGSSTASGLDGSKFASEGNVLVVFVQYRLGAFGFFHTDSTLDEASVNAESGAHKVPGNQAVRDVVQSLLFLRDHVAEFGGNPSSITVAGQSSGAHMVRTLLTLPAANSLFHRAILHSDPSNYGPATAQANSMLGKSVAQQLGCGDLACLRSRSAQDVLQASDNAASMLPQQDGSIPVGEPWRPFLGSYFSQGIESAGSAIRDVIMTTVRNEAGSQVGSMLQPTAQGASKIRLDANYGPMSQVDLSAGDILDMLFNEGRGDILSAQSAYFAASEHDVDDGLRCSIEEAATDGLYRCGSWSTASRLNLYLAVHHTGMTYPSNDGNTYCSAGGRVCHEDDIYALFDTHSQSGRGGLSPRQTSYAQELRERWLSFIKTGDPNTAKHGGWQKAAAGGSGGGGGEGGGQKVQLLQLGSEDDGSSLIDSVDMGVCHDTWGSAVRFDWQLYQ